MGNPVIVQGTAVPVTTVPEPTYGNTAAADVTTENHQPSKTGCKDPIFAFLFYADVVAIAAVAATLGKGALESSDTDIDYLAYVSCDYNRLGSVPSASFVPSFFR